MSEFVILLSCMHQHDHSILERSNVQTNIIVVNQCDVDVVEEFSFTNKHGQKRWCKFISTTERGLSRSRNMAIRNAPEKSICLIADDDETFVDNLEEIVIKAYRDYPTADLIAFSLIRNDLSNVKIYPSEHRILKFRQILRTSSQQISFRLSALKNFDIQFDEKMGSGTGNGGGEENQFMLSLKRAGATMHFVPERIATVNPGESQWFKGYTAEYMQNLGWSSRRSMGSLIGLLYLNYWVLTHQGFYKKDITTFEAFKNVMRGYLSKR